MTKALLALLLALRQLQVPLTSEEKEALKTVAAQLALDRDDWEWIEQGLRAVVQGNTELKRYFEFFQARLEKLEQIPTEVLPSWEELERELPTTSTSETFAIDEEELDFASNETLNATTRILSAVAPIQTIKQFVALQRLEGFLGKSDNLPAGELPRPYPDLPSLAVEEPTDERLRVGETIFTEIKGATQQTLKTSRYFNTYLCKPDRPTVILNNEPLVQGQIYILHIDISPERKGTDETNVPFPDEAIAQIWEKEETLSVDVVVSSHDFLVPWQVKKLKLPRQGTSEVIGFMVIPKLGSGRGLLQVELFYRGYLLQAKQVEAIIIPHQSAEVPESMLPIQRTRVTFTTTDQLTTEQLKLTPERFLTIDVERNQRDGSIDFRFLDRTQGNQELAFYDTILQPAALGKAVAGVRKQLNLAAREGYEWVDKGEMDLLNNWLPRFAQVGRYLYRAILPQNQGNPASDDQGEKLPATLEPGITIQVNPIIGQVTIPWALLYERNVKYESGKTRVCEYFLTSKEDCLTCPHADDDYIVCPYSFWGYRYAIEQLPCWVTGELPQPTALVKKIANDQPLWLNFNVWENFSLWRDHLPKLQAAGQVQVLIASKIAKLEQLWRDRTSWDLIYFYCHGGIDEIFEQPYLEISDGRIDSNFLEASELKWSHHPLVFLNGCATGDYTPESYMSLIDDFRVAGACGVIGTECPVPEMFAESYAAALLPRLFKGEPLGQAMLRVRQELLREKLNPLGLVYSLYAAHEIVLSHAVGLIN